MEPKLTLDTEKPTNVRWQIFVLACFSSWLLYLHRYTFALIKPALVEEWKLGKDALGLLDGAFFLPYTLFQIPLGIATTAWGVHLMLSLMLISGAIGLAMHAWATDSQSLAAARGLLGFGQSAVFAALNQITRNWFPLSVRTTVQGWLGVFFGRFGGLSANLLVGSVMLGMLGLSWRTTVVVLALVGLVHAAFFIGLFRNSPRQHPRVNQAEAELIESQDGPQAANKRPPTFRELFRQLRPRTLFNLLMLNIQTILSTLADTIFSAWIPLFLWEVHQLKFEAMGFYAALPLLGGALGGAFGGWLNDRLIAQTGRRRWSRVAVGGAGKGIAAGLLVTSLLWFDQPRTFCLLLFVVKFFSDWSLVTTWGCVTDMSGRASATVFAYNNTVAGIGSIVGPPLYGTIAESAGWTPVFVAGAITYLACALSWLMINSELSLEEQPRAESVSM